MPRNLNGLPSDALVEMSVGDIDKGGLVREMNSSMREALQALEARKKRGTTSGEVVITAQVRIGYDEELEDHVRITSVVTLKTPKNDKVSLAKAIGGRLLCQPGGADATTPNQMPLFGHDGEALGILDRRTGEIVEPPASVVGMVGRA